MPTAEELHQVVIHGHRRAYRKTGSGPVLLLLHGLGCDSSTWADVIPALAEKYTVIAPDLLGHGESAKPNADYSLGAYANGLRDLLTVLNVGEKVTVVGHSLGGGIAMQFAYQFPERTERVCLVSSGGLGREVSPIIRFLTLPGSGAVLAAITKAPLRPVVAAGLRRLSRLPVHATRDLDEVSKIYESLADPAVRTVVRRLTSQVLDWRGQYVTMTDRAYLTLFMPFLVIWGRDDRVVPASHAAVASECATGAQVHVLEDSGHFPHKDHPAKFIELVTEFIESTEPAHYHRGKWRALLRRGNQAELAVVD